MAAITGGKYVHVGASAVRALTSLTAADHFDGKAEIADYALARFGPGHFSASRVAWLR